MKLIGCLLPAGNLTFSMMDIMLAPTRSLQNNNTTEVDTLGHDGCRIPIILLSFNIVFYAMILACLVGWRFKRP